MSVLVRVLRRAALLVGLYAIIIGVGLSVVWLAYNWPWTLLPLGLGFVLGMSYLMIRLEDR